MENNKIVRAGKTVFTISLLSLIIGVLGAGFIFYFFGAFGAFTSPGASQIITFILIGAVGLISATFTLLALSRRLKNTPDHQDTKFNILGCLYIAVTMFLTFAGTAALANPKSILSIDNLITLAIIFALYQALRQHNQRVKNPAYKASLYPVKVKKSVFIVLLVIYTSVLVFTAISGVKMVNLLKSYQENPEALQEKLQQW